MGELTKLFDLFMYGAAVFLVAAVVLFVVWLRWKAGGQERGM